MTLKVDARIKGYGPHPARTQALATVIVEFEGPQETMEINVLVPNEGDAATVRRQAMERAKGFARRFLDFPNTKVGWQ